MTNYLLDPFDYQTDDARFIIQNKRCGILHEPGVGKTFSVYIAMTYLAEKYKGSTIVVIPPILFNEWTRKFKEYFESDLKVVEYKGTPPERKEILKTLGKADIVLISYAIMMRELPQVQAKMNNLMMLVADEYKFIKSPKAKAFKTFQKATYKIDYLVLMNGTPVVKSPADIFPLIHLINPNIYVTQKNFLRRHAKYMKGDSGFPVIVGWKNLDQLNKLVNKYSRRLLKKDVLKDLPEKKLIIKQFSLGDRHLKKLKEFWEFGLLELDNDELLFAQANALITKIRQYTIDPSPMEVKEKSTYFDMLEITLEEVGTDQGIIFAHYHSTSDALKAYFDARDITYAVVDGRCTPKQKDAAIEAHRAGEVQWLLGNAKSMGVGLDLQHCHNVIYFELDYEVDNFWQGMDRVHRPGQTISPNIYVFVAEKTPAVALLKSIMSNVNFVAEILAGNQSHSSFFEDSITVKDEMTWQQT